MRISSATASFAGQRDWLSRASATLLIPGLKSEGTLRAWEAAGSAPPHYRIGGRVMYRRVDIEEWVAKRRIEPTATSKYLDALVLDNAL